MTIDEAINHLKNDWYINFDNKKELVVDDNRKFEFIEALGIAIENLRHIMFSDDPESIRTRGKWERSLLGEDLFRCSNCCAVWYRKFEYCPHCGSNMDLED